MPDDLVFCDSHSHLFMREFDLDREAVFARAESAGVLFCVAVGFSLETSREAISCAERYPRVVASVGIHPHHATDATEESLRRLREIAAHPTVVAVGETGLDFYRNLSPRSDQETAFRRQIRLARELSLPLIVHDREAHADLLRILREERADQMRGVFHCFSGDLPLAEAAWEMGWYTSFAGPLTYPKSDLLREVARKAPADRILVETDCPYLPPQPFRGKRNEPAYLLPVAETLALLRDTSLNEIARLTTANIERLFQLSEKTRGPQNG